MRELPSGTVTFLFTDIEGSTRLLEELGGEAYAAVLAEHHRVCREAWAAQGGVEVDTEGDAFFVVFERAGEALAAAQAAQQALAEGRVRVRMGLHTGEVLLTETGYVGRELHRAARIAASGHGGQVVLSEQTRAAAGDGFAFVELGEHRFKDFDEPLPLYQLGECGFPPLKTVSNTNLPRPASSYIGREHELREVLTRLEHGARLVTLTGPGGSGKTRLALEAAAALVPEYKAGVFWVGLAALRDPTLVTETIAQTLGAKDGLAEHIGERELLLLLDNLEQVIEAAPELSRLLQACANLTLLVTSRELLRVQGELEYPVPPLVEPEAVELFCERAQTEPSEEIAELCVRLDNLPLAVELAAARARALSPTQILGRLGRRLDLLKGGRDADPRQQTLRATIEWSYDLLTEREQELFRRMAVFAGGCTLEAAEQVAGADLDTLQSLVEKSLLRYSNERYWMLETIREFALERLAESGEADELAVRHAQFFVELVEHMDPQLRGQGQEQALEALDREHDNVRAGIESAARLGLRELKAQLAGAAWYFWYLRGHAAEGVSRLKRALSAGPADPASRARLHEGLTSLEVVRGNHKAARSHSDTSLRLRRELGEPNGILRSLTNRAVLAGYEGDVPLGGALHAECAELARQVGDRWFLALALSNLAWVAIEREDYEEAAGVGAEALDLLREIGDAQMEAACSLNLAQAELGLGRTSAGLARLTEFLERQADLKMAEPTLWCLEVVATALLEAAPERCARLLGATAAIAADLGYVLAEKYQRRRRRARAELEERLAPEALVEAWAAGSRMTMDAAVGYALESIASAAGPGVAPRARERVRRAP